MIHTLYTLTLRRYSEFLDTGNDALLCVKHPRIAQRVYRKRIEALKDRIIELFQSDLNGDIRKMVHKMKSWNRIITMQALLDAIRIHLVDKVQLDLLTKNRTEDTGLVKLLEAAQGLFGIEVKTLDDIQALYDKLEFFKDKYNENFPEKKVEETEQFTFTESYQQVFNFLEQTINADMTLIEFAGLRKLAQKKLKDLELMMAKNKANGGH